MIIDGVEYVPASEQAPIRDDQPPYGGVMLVETVTKFYVGEVAAVHPQEIVLMNAAWVADTGRYHKFLQGESDDNVQVEPCPDGPVIIGRGSIISAQPYRQGVIRVVK